MDQEKAQDKASFQTAQQPSTSGAEEIARNEGKAPGTSNNDSGRVVDPTDKAVNVEPTGVNPKEQQAGLEKPTQSED
jgi:hypothetical protein